MSSQYLANITGDVFGLNYIYDRQVDNVENRNFFYWREQPIYGYLGGGLTNPSTSISTVSRIDFSNETVSNPDKNLSYNTYLNQGLSASSYGYFVGGISRSTISRLDFANETVSDPGNNLPTNRWITAYFSAANYGYINSGVDGIFGFPQSGNGPYSALTTRLDFSNEVFSNPGRTYGAKESGGSVSSGNYGYDCGGYYYRPPTNGLIDQSYTEIYRFDFFTENYITPPSVLSSARTQIASTFSLLYGYLAGGTAPSPQGGIRSTIDRLDFSNDTVSSPKSLPGAREGGRAVATSNFGYFCGGSLTNTITRLDFSNETVSDPGKNLIATLSYMAMVSGGESRLKDNQNYGYFAGGFAPPQISTITRLDFSNETMSNPGKNLPSVRSELASVSSNYYGYFGGGFAPPQISNITRIDFINEIINDSIGNLPSNRRLLTATESGSYGYWAGGFSSPPDTYLSTITRFDFTTEIAANTPTNLPSGRRDFVSTSTNYYAYFGAGFDGTSFLNTISRLEFSNETASNPGKNLPQTIRNLASFKSATYGYFGGGEFPAPTPFSISNIARLDFSNETVSNPGNLLPSIRRGLSATASRNYGYFTGGFTPSYISTVTRLDFSNEVISNPVNVLPSARADFTGLTNAN